MIAGAVVGVVFLLRGCLAAYDERAALPPLLYFEKDGRQIVFAIVKYESATSYRSGGGYTSKTVSTNYYLQTNDAVTGEKIAVKKIKHHSDVKNFPVTIMGKSDGMAWVFIGEPMAFDPFTLDKKADKEIIETKNVALKGKMPDQQQYYKYDNNTGELVITATDGQKYRLSAGTLLASPVDEDDEGKGPLQAAINAFEKQQKYYDDINEQYYRRTREFNKLYAAKQIDYSIFLDSTKYFNRQNDAIRRIKDSLREKLSDLMELKRAGDDRSREIENLKGTNRSFTNICVEADTMNGRWYGLSTTTEMEKFNKRFGYRSNYEETSRNKLYGAPIAVKDPSKHSADVEIDQPEKISDGVFLQGGFLLDKSTALPIHLKNDDGFIVAYKEKVGYTGNILFSRIDLKGNIKWTVNSNASQLADWIITSRSLVLASMDNKELSSGDANVLTIIDLQNGKTVTYDYFTDKMRTTGR